MIDRFLQPPRLYIDRDLKRLALLLLHKLTAFESRTRDRFCYENVIAIWDLSLVVGHQLASLHCIGCT